MPANPYVFNTTPYMDPNQTNAAMAAWQRGLANQQNQLQLAGLANQRTIADLQGKYSLQGLQMQGDTAKALAAANNASALQRTGMETASAQQIAAGQQAGATQRTQMEQAGLTEREKMAIQGQIDIANLTTAEQERVARYQADQQLAGTKYSSDTAAKTAADQLAAQTLRFNTLLPLLQNYYDQSTTGSGTTDLTVSIPQAPAITTGGVYSPQQIQQQVNATRAKTDTDTATKQQQMRKDLAGRGFGANSPLAAELATMMRGQGLAANTDAEQGLRFNAAGANAQQRLAAEQLAQQQYQSQLQFSSQLQQNKIAQQNALLAALASLAG